MNLSPSNATTGELGNEAPALRTNSYPRRRSRFRASVQVLRRCHLYAGLFMLPWTVLYGITAFLFNHPTAFSDQPTVSFGKEALAGTPMESPPLPAELAQQIVAALRVRNPDASYALIEPDNARYSREFAFAVVRADGREVNVLIDALGRGGTVRSRPVTPPKPPEEKAPFAIGGRDAPNKDLRAKPPESGRSATGDSLRIDQPLHERVKAAVPALLDKTGFPQGEVTVSSVPDLIFLMKADDKVWKVTYNLQSGSVSGRSPDADGEPPALSARQFLLRLHLAHGYPYEGNSRWGWALAVDVMAFIMLFWGVSGLLMWWQIKATRRLGAVVLILSTLVAVWVGLAMHDQMTAGLANR